MVTEEGYKFAVDFWLKPKFIGVTAEVNYHFGTGMNTSLNMLISSHGAHLTGAQLLICPKCPSTTPIEAASTNITTQSGQRIGLRNYFPRVDARLKSSTMMHILHY